jgi:enamine deaminase RidA (YjgF/YER057c/UK114 family)
MISRQHRAFGILEMFWGAWLCLYSGAAVSADEGMWLLNHPPREHLEKVYDFDLADAWLKRAQLASVRFNNGGSGGFVSADGLVVTNHHVGADSLQKLSPKDKDYYRDGFYARARHQELKCPDLELNVLQSMEDVTARVQAAVPAGTAAAQASVARRSVLAAIEKESLDQTGLRSDVVTLYQGGMYHLYRYKKYTDVRLVMAPEHAIASFGGDTDNFEYPRHSLDICFFRVYENGQPARTPLFFPWSSTGPEQGDLVFVSGHPGTTNRLETVERLEHRRDQTLPYFLNRARLLEALLLRMSDLGPELARMAAGDLQRIANTRKASDGQYQGLLDPAIMARKKADEQTLRQRVAADPQLQATCAGAWDEIAAAEKTLTLFEREHALLETGHAFESQLFRFARHLVRLAEEKPKPSAQRLREYRDSNLESLQFELFSPAPIHRELERVKLTGSLSLMAEVMGGNDPLLAQILAGQGPAARVTQIVNGTSLTDPAVRRHLAGVGRAAIEASTDPMIRLAILVDSAARELRKRYENEVEEVERQAYAQTARARFALLGSSVPPDATFTLRLAFGVVKGYRVDGAEMPFHTTFGSAFARAEQMKYKEPFNLPECWRRNKNKLDSTTPFNFVSTADTIGGNSGSPVLNRAGELVGINFDRNRHGLVRNFVYSDEQARHIAVHSRGVLEALRQLYDASPLVAELTGKAKP